MKRLAQIVPAGDFRLFGAMVRKEIELTKKNGGTFYRSGGKEENRAKWSHLKYQGWINLERSRQGEVVTVEIHSRARSENEWQLVHAFLGWVDRHFGQQISAINIQYRK
jgi:hypothetical protein